MGEPSDVVRDGYSTLLDKVRKYKWGMFCVDSVALHVYVSIVGEIIPQMLDQGQGSG